MLELHWWLYRNPWSHTVPTSELTSIVIDVARKRAEHVNHMFDSGYYTRDSLGLVILDPTAPLWRPSSETLLCAIAIGPEGQRFIQNALAKAIYHRDHGHAAGYGVYMDLAESADGDFCYGFSTQVDGTIAGASAQKEIQDAMEAGHAAVSFNYYIRGARWGWLNDREESPPHWFCNQDEPGVDYREMLKREAIAASGASVVLP